MPIEESFDVVRRVVPETETFFIVPSAVPGNALTLNDNTTVITLSDGVTIITNNV